MVARRAALLPRDAGAAVGVEERLHDAAAGGAAAALVRAARAAGRRARDSGSPGNRAGRPPDRVRRERRPRGDGRDGV